MQVSAEIRWFWSGAVSGLTEWFSDAKTHGFGAGGGRVRVDEYLRAPGQRELGLKRRGSKKGVEVKGLVHVDWMGVTAGPFSGPIEIWTKWATDSLELAAGTTVTTEKKRWLRKFDTAGAAPIEIELDADEKPARGAALPGLGCNVELTEVKLPGGAVAWTLGFESFGSLATITNDLRAVAALLADRRPPALPPGERLAYPAWLSTRLG